MTKNTNQPDVGQRPADALPYWHPRANWKPRNPINASGLAKLDDLESSRRIRRSERENKGHTIGDAMAAMSRDDKRLVLAISKVDDELYYLRDYIPTARAARIVEGFEPWPRVLLVWKGFREECYYHGIGKHPKPPWIDRDATRKRPSRMERERNARAKFERSAA